MNQAAFARALGVGQGNLSKWENGKNAPSPELLTRIAQLAPDESDRDFFLAAAGIPKRIRLGTISIDGSPEFIDRTFQEIGAALRGANTAAVSVPLLSDAVAAGNPFKIDERDIESYIPLPKAWLRGSEEVYLLHVEGDSMSPILSDGAMVLVDVAQRSPAKLNHEMVAALVDDGVTIKYLRKSGKYWQLVPQNTSPRHEIRVLTEMDDWLVVGKVVKCISDPPSPRR